MLADRCFLAAVTDSFTPNQVMIAGRLGIGLVRVWQTPAGRYRLAEVLAAPTGQPVEELRFQAADRLGLAACSLCRGLFRRYVEKPDDYKAVVRASVRGRLQRAGDEEKGLIWWLGKQAEEHGRIRESGIIRVRRYLCPSCVGAIAPD